MCHCAAIYSLFIVAMAETPAVTLPAKRSLEQVAVPTEASPAKKPRLADEAADASVQQSPPHPRVSPVAIYTLRINMEIDCHGQAKCPIGGANHATCKTCGGQGTVTAETAYGALLFKQMWCKCVDNSGGDTEYFENYEHFQCIENHHYHCNRCGFIKQIG